MRTFPYLFLALALFATALRADEAPSLPDRFTVTERILALSTTFDLADGRRPLGTARKRILSLATQYDLTDAGGRSLGYARKRILSWGSHVDVFDSGGRKVGAVREQIFKSLFKVRTVYSILDHQDAVIAESEKVDFFSTTFTIRDRRGRTVATLQRPALRLRDYWTVQITDHRAVDSRLLLTIGVFKTDSDNAKPN